MPRGTSVTFDQKQLRSITRKLEPRRYRLALDKGLTAFGGLAETRIGLEANKTVYSYEPKDPEAYRRTGRLLGGRGGLSNGKPNKKRLSLDTIKIEANPRLKGARFNYAPWVNAGKGYMKGVGERPFWDNAYKWIESKGVERALERMKKAVDKIIKM